MNAGQTFSALAVFAQGILSFFSPCVLPLLPLYMGYLSGGAACEDENGVMRWPRKKILVNTLFFILGISFAFFALGFGITALGGALRNGREWIARVSGVIIILLGLWQLGVFRHTAAMEKERRISLSLDKLAMNPVTALLLGFTFSFAWTPCVGPALSSVLLMAASSADAGRGYALIGLYTLGFVLPFMALGLFTGAVLSFFKAHRQAMKNTVKIGAALLIVMGVLTLTGLSGSAAGALSRASSGDTAAVSSEKPAADTALPTASERAQPSPSAPAASPAAALTAAETKAPAVSAAPKAGSAAAAPAKPAAQATPAPTPAPAKKTVTPAPDFTLSDQNGTSRTLSAYAGKVVFLNFWATWCGPCRSELGDIQALYNAHGANSGDVIVLGIAAPEWSGEGTADEVASFLSDNGYTYPVVMDLTANSFYNYGISAFPTTYIIGRDGAIFTHVVGAMSGDAMEKLVQQALDAG